MDLWIAAGLLTLLVVAPCLGLTIADVLQPTVAFLAIGLLLSQASYRFHIHRRSY